MLIAFLKNRVLASKYAIVGAIALVKNEPSIQLQTIISIGVTVVGFVFNISLQLSGCISVLQLAL